jgi:release factor glutamine methyltransferase
MRNNARPVRFGWLSAIMSNPVNTIAASLRTATERLSAVSETARLDAEILMAHALGCARSDMLMRQHDLSVPENFAELVERRAASEPVAYIRGVQEFWNLTLAVTPDVLIPRGDSETLIEAALEAFKGRKGPELILDLGTGSGALLLAALSEFPEAHGVGVDASAAAIAVAVGNAERLGFGARASMLQASWKDEGWSQTMKGPYDLILCNPPYVEDDAELDATVGQYEPHSALFAGAEGLDDYRILIPALAKLLAPKGVAIFEIGYTQAQAVSDLASKAGLSTEMRTDLGGNPRALRFSLGITRTQG